MRFPNQRAQQLPRMSATWLPQLLGGSQTSRSRWRCRSHLIILSTRWPGRSALVVQGAGKQPLNIDDVARLQGRVSVAWNEVTSPFRVRVTLIDGTVPARVQAGASPASGI